MKWCYSACVNWFIFCLLSVFALATAELIQQYVINSDTNEIDDKASGFLTFGLPAVLMFPLILNQFKWQTFIIFNLNILPFFLIATAASALGTVFYLKSFNVKSISYSTIFVSSSAIFSTILGIIIYGESVLPLKFLGIGLILGGIILTNIKNEVFEKQSLWGLLAGFFYGTLYICDKWFVTEIDPLLYLFWSLLFTALILLIFNPVHIINKLPKLKVRDIRVILMSGFAYLIYNLFTFLAYNNGGEVGRVDAINNSQIFLIIIFEIIFMHQKEHAVRKILSFLLAISGIVILSAVN